MVKQAGVLSDPEDPASYVPGGSRVLGKKFIAHESGSGLAQGLAVEPGDNGDAVLRRWTILCTGFAADLDRRRCSTRRTSVLA